MDTTEIESLYHVIYISSPDSETFEVYEGRDYPSQYEETIRPLATNDIKQGIIKAYRFTHQELEPASLQEH